MYLCRLTIQRTMKYLESYENYKSMLTECIRKMAVEDSFLNISTAVIHVQYSSIFPGIFVCIQNNGSILK